MGFLEWFRGYSTEERHFLELRRTMITQLVGGAPGAEQFVEMQMSLAERAIKEVRKGRLNLLPRNLGQIILGQAEPPNSSPEVRAITDAIVALCRKRLPMLRREGVRDGDILWCWNLPAFERRCMELDDNAMQLAGFGKQRDEAIARGMSEEEAGNAAMARVRKSCPMYGEPDDTGHVSGDDRALPLELKNRVLDHAEQLSPTELWGKCSRFSTMNAFIRSEMREGRL